MTLHHPAFDEAEVLTSAVDLADMLNDLLNDEKEWGGLQPWQAVDIYNLLASLPVEIRTQMREPITGQVLEKETRRDWTKAVKGSLLDGAGVFQ